MSSSGHVGADNSITSRDLRILVDQAAEPVAFSDADASPPGATGILLSGGLWQSARRGRWVL